MPIRLNERDIRMATAYLTGQSMPQIAAKESLSHQRVAQRLDKVARHLGLSSFRHALYNPNRYLTYLRALMQTHSTSLALPAETPEEFYLELLYEPRQAQD
jgi:hypothetical protein